MNIKELESKLKDVKGELRLNDWTYIYDLEKFITGHLSALKCNSGNKGYLPYYYRLLEVYKKIYH